MHKDPRAIYTDVQLARSALKKVAETTYPETDGARGGTGILSAPLARVRSYRYRWVPADGSAASGSRGKYEPNTPSPSTSRQTAAEIQRDIDAADVRRAGEAGLRPMQELAQQGGNAPAGVNLADAAARNAEREKRNRAAARDTFHNGIWKGDYNRSVDSLYNEMAADRYTDSRWQAFKNSVRRLFGSTDRDAQKTYKNWRGYTREKARRTNWWLPDWIGPAKGSGFWDAEQGVDADLDMLRAAAYARREADRKLRSETLRREQAAYERALPGNMDLTRLPDKWTEYTLGENGKMVPSVHTADGQGMTKARYNAAASQWAERMLGALHLENGHPLYGRARAALISAAQQSMYDSDYKRGWTLRDALRDGGLSGAEVDRLIENFRNSTASPSDYTIARLLNSIYG